MSNKQKAIDINIESLKLYLTLSTISIGGLMAFFTSKYGGFRYSFIISIGFFFICAVSSIYSINTFINKVDRNEINVRARDSVRSNFVAIFSFIIAIVFAAIYFYNSQKKITNEKEVLQGIVVTKDTLKIGRDVKTKAIIELDTLGRFKSVKVNQ